MSRQSLRPHLFVPDPDAGKDWRGDGRCLTCHLPESRADMHELPDMSEAAAEGARRLGEREDG